MTHLQEGTEKMSVAAVSFLAANTAITAALPNFSVYLATIQTTNSQILTAKVQQEADKSGDTVNKNMLRANLIVLAIDVVRRVVAYAMNVNNNSLLKLVNYTESDLKKSSDSNLVSICQVIRDNANANVTALAAYGITAAVLTTLQTAITNFNTAIPKGRVDTTDSAEATKQLSNLFKILAANWEKIDTLVEMVRTAQPNFYDEYQKVRKVIETGTGSLTVKALVTDAITGEPIKNATLLFSLESTNGLAKSAKAATERIVKKTAEKGGVNIKTLPTGIYKVIVKKTGYADQEATIAVTDGEITYLNIQLLKN